MFGNVKNEAGLLFNKGNFKLVKKILKKDEEIAKHNHEDEEIIFTVLNIPIVLNSIGTPPALRIPSFTACTNVFR